VSRLLHDGGHVAAPLALDPQGRTALADDEAYLRGLVEHVLFTRPGERVRRPDFGSGVDALVFAPAGDELAQATQALVHGALQRFLGDLLRVEDVTVTSDEGRIDVLVRFQPLHAPAEEPPRTVRVSGGPGPLGTVVP
jgi:phage baseplate assembly protein W